MTRASLLLALLAACASPDPAPPPPVDGMLVGVVAHRGASHEAPENTLAALERAWSLGAEACEIDARVSFDGQVVLMHDDSAHRTGGLRRKVADLTLAELKALDVGRWKGERYRGERVPTLAEALATVPRGRTLFVEIKGGARTATAVAAAIRAADPRPRGAEVALQAFDPDALAVAASLLPGVASYWTVDRPFDPFTDQRTSYPASLADEAVGRGFTGLALDHEGVGPDLQRALKVHDLQLDVWTVNDRRGLARWLRRARWVETDHPDRAR